MSRASENSLGVVAGITFCLCVLFGVGYLVGAWLQGISFEQNCRGYLKRAADANTVVRARDELEKAIKFMDSNDLTKGSTHIFYVTPDCDVEYWYGNIKDSYDELVEFPSDADHLTTSNQLMKLRETLLDDAGGEQGGVEVTCPPRIEFYPNQTLWWWGGFFATIAAMVGALAGSITSAIFFKN